MFRLYEYAPSGNCYKVRMLLSRLNKPFERIEMDIRNGATRTDDFLKLNSNGRVPVLVDGDVVLTESNAILWYLGRDSDLLPDDVLSQARILQWMFFEQYSHEPYIATLRNWISYANNAAEYADEIEKRRPLGYAALDVMEKHLATHAFFCGAGYSIADVALYAYTHVADEGEFDLSGYAAIDQWLNRVRTQPRHITIKQ